MRIVFMGTGSFAVPSLLACAEAHDVSAVYSRPDSPAGRGRHLRESPVKSAALALGLPVMQPVSLRQETAAEALSALRPDVVCVAAYGLMLPLSVLKVPDHGCLNVHGSLLPLYRGAAPIERAILDGAVSTGVSIMRMEEGLDTGPYALQVSMLIEGKSAGELREDLARLGADALLSVLASVAAGSARWSVQDDAKATYAAKVTPADVAMDPASDAVECLRRVRASSRSAPSRAVVAGIALTVEAASPGTGDAPQGVARVADGSLILGTAKGTVTLDRVVPAGRRPMGGSDFARGARIGDATWERPS
jgi:methionyl-tRNA formyltransferase